MYINKFNYQMKHFCKTKFMKNIFNNNLTYIIPIK